MRRGTKFNCLVTFLLTGYLVILVVNETLSWEQHEHTEALTAREINDPTTNMTRNTRELVIRQNDKEANYINYRNHPENKVTEEQSGEDFVFPNKVYLGRWMTMKKLDCKKSEQKQRLPNVLLLGERKTGTFKIVQFLVANNPRITTSMLGETRFFDLESEYEKGLGWYQKQMAPSCPGDVTIVKTPSYFRTPKVPKRVHAWNSDIRLIVSLRDPVARAISDFHFEQRSFKKYRNSTFAQMALTKKGKVNSVFPPIARSLYYANFQRWLQFYPMEQFHVIDADLFASNNPSQELIKVEKYVGLTPYCTPDKFYKTKGGFYQIVGKKYVSGGIKGHSHPPVPKHVINKLQQFYKPSVKRLYSLMGRKLSWMGPYIK